MSQRRLGEWLEEHLQNTNHGRSVGQSCTAKNLSYIVASQVTHQDQSKALGLCGLYDTPTRVIAALEQHGISELFKKSSHKRAHTDQA
jgi:hypothetical protein